MIHFGVGAAAAARQLLAPAAVLAGASLVGALLVGTFAGCSSEAPKKVEPTGEKQAAKSTGEGEQGKSATDTPAQPDAAQKWNAQVAKIKAILGDKGLDEAKLEEAKQALDQFAVIYTAPDKPSEAQQKQLEELGAELATRQRELVAVERAAKLEEAQQQMEKGNYEAANQAANRVLAISPTEEQEEKAKALLDRVGTLWARQRKLRGLVRLLGSENRQDVTAAQSQLAAEPDVALSLLIEAVQDAEKPLLVRNALDLMRRMRRPDIALPAMVAVLARPEQKANWEDVVRELLKIKEPGAGKPLLDLVLSSKNPEQRTAALRVLASVVDPPAETEIALLPVVMEDSPSLPLTLQVMYQAIRAHGKYDAQARRGLEVELTSEQEEQLAALPARLKSLIEAGAKATPPSEAAQAAKVLAIALKIEEPQVLTGVKVFGFSAEVEDGAAAATLDGKWNAVELPTMWRHPITERSSIVLDLGEERTIVGVRVWNFNELNQGVRGWKEVEVFVSETPRPLEPNASGIIPMAPGAADTPDYSTTIPVGFVRGRYVKLQAKSFWKSDVYTGLTEIQVIGF